MYQKAWSIEEELRTLRHMKKTPASILLFIFVFLISRNISAQIIKKDSVSISDYATGAQAWYDFRTGIKGTSAFTNWEMAVTTDPRDAAIRVNHWTGLRVYKYPKDGIGAWKTFDTSGWKNWNKSFNNIHNYSIGALNSYANFAQFKYGWGHYLGAFPYDVVGDSLYLFVWVDQTESPVKFMKFKPTKVIGVTADFVFSYGNVKDTVGTTDTLFQSQANNQLFKYYKFSDKSKPVREPNKNDWDITFTRYYEKVQGIDYGVVGVESNRGYVVARVFDKTFDQYVKDSCNLAKTTPKDSFKMDMTAVGSDYKFFDGQKYVMFPNKNYIIKSIRPANNDTAYFLVNFTNYVGGKSGKSVFTYCQLKCIASAYSPVFGNVQLFPNPAANKLYVNMGEVAFGKADLKIINTEGKVVEQVTIDQSSRAASSYMLEVGHWAKGVYFVQIAQGKNQITQKLVIE